MTEFARRHRALGQLAGRRGILLGGLGFLCLLTGCSTPGLVSRDAPSKVVKHTTYLASGLAPREKPAAGSETQLVSSVAEIRGAAPADIPAADTPAGLATVGSDPTATGAPAESAGELLPAPQADAGFRPSRITLTQAIQETLQSNFSIQAEAQTIEQANADVVTATLLPNPQLTLDALLLPFPGRPFTPTKQGGPPQYDALVYYPLDWLLFGKRQATITSQRWATGVAQANYDNLVRQRLSQTVMAYYDILEAKALLELSKVDVQNLQRVEQMTIRRIELGGAGNIELDRVRLALLNSQRDVRQREVTLASARSTLKALLGRTDADPNFDVVGSLGVAEPAAEVTVEEILTLAEENRPDIVSIRQQLAKAEADIAREETRAYPQVSGMLGFTYQQQKSTIGFPDAPSYNGAVTASVPLFDRNQGNISRARSVYWQTNYQLQSQLAQVRAEVEQAVVTYQTARSIVTTTDPAQQASAANVRDKIAAAYEIGGRPLTEVLNTQQSYRETMRLLITGQSGYWRSLYRVNFTAGAPVLR